MIYTLKTEIMKFPFIQQNASLPVGSITAFAGEINTTKTPENNKSQIEELGWLVCDGRTLETHNYPELFAVLGYLYGGSDNNFKIPDLRGMFLRGVGADSASNELRTKASGGEDNGVGSSQTFAVQKHVHVYTSPIKAAIAASVVPPATVPADNDINTKDTTAEPTENIEQGKVKVSDYETRPTNTFVYYIIKYIY